MWARAGAYLVGAADNGDLIILANGDGTDLRDRERGREQPQPVI